MKQLAVVLIMAAATGLGLVGAPTRALAATTCTGTINGGTIHGGLVVEQPTPTPSPLATCVLNGVTVDGGIMVLDSGRLFLNGSTVNGGVQVNAPGGVFWECSSLDHTTPSTINGGVNVTAARVAQIGGSGDDPNDNLNGIIGPAPCGTGQTVNGGVHISGVTVHAEVDSATVNGGVVVSNNTLSPVTSTSEIAVEGNTIHGSLTCSNNTPNVRNNGEPNTVTGTDNCPGS